MRAFPLMLRCELFASLEASLRAQALRGRVVAAPQGEVKK